MHGPEDCIHTSSVSMTLTQQSNRGYLLTGLCVRLIVWAAKRQIWIVSKAASQATLQHELALEQARRSPWT